MDSVRSDVSWLNEEIYRERPECTRPKENCTSAQKQKYCVDPEKRKNRGESECPRPKECPSLQKERYSVDPEKRTIRGHLNVCDEKTLMEICTVATQICKARTIERPELERPRECSSPQRNRCSTDPEKRTIREVDICPRVVREDKIRECGKDISRCPVASHLCNCHTTEKSKFVPPRCTSPQKQKCSVDPDKTTIHKVDICPRAVREDKIRKCGKDTCSEKLITDGCPVATQLCKCRPRERPERTSPMDCTPPQRPKYSACPEKKTTREGGCTVTTVLCKTPELAPPRDCTSPQRKKYSVDPEKRTMREVNKRLRGVYEDDGREYGHDVYDPKTLGDRFKVAIQLCKARIEEVFRNIRRSRNVELCFLVDATGSMQPHIDGVRKSIQSIVEKLTATHVTFGNCAAQSMSLSFVAYRDYGDKNHFEILPFTTSITTFKAFCGNIRATGGGDGPEDVFGGLETALKLDWTANCGTKVLFHICDYPCHGKAFHCGMNDYYPCGDPKGRTHKALFCLLREKKIQYYFGKITDDTNIMIKKFEEAYGEPITQFDIKKVDDIRESVITAVSESISSSISCSRRTSGVPRKERDYRIDCKEPCWTSCSVLKGTFVSYKFPACIKDVIDDLPLERKKPKCAQVKIAANPFGKGAERIAFYGMDVSAYSSTKSYVVNGVRMTSKEKKIVLKEYLHTGRGMNSARRYELSNQMQTIASYLALEFCDELDTRANIKKSIKFIKIKTLSVSVATGNRFMSCERRFSAEDKFVRFTNNAGYKIMEDKAVRLGIPAEFVQLVMAFSHWTYKATNGFLMVVDLQGVVGNVVGGGETGVLLTDPAIHCHDVTRYGAMNHGPLGMKNFLERHVCNQFCKDLGLDRFR